jgi:GNAT superfamily N-acetyltransferase
VTGWTPPLVLGAAADWIWVPDGADQVRTEDYQLIRYPDRLTDPTWPPAQVAWSRTSRPLGEVIDEVAGHVRAWGLREVHWWVSDATAPAGTEEVLRTRAGTLTETLHVLGYELGTGPPKLELPDGISVELVHDERTMRAAALLETQGWGRPEPDDADMASRLAEVTGDLPDRSSFRVVAFLDHRPVAVAGYTLAGPVARLWGAVTLPAWQGRGAYRWLLAERLRLASAQGATIALVKGRAATSGPILRRAGFTDYGQERRYRLPLDWESEPGMPPR